MTYSKNAQFTLLAGNEINDLKLETKTLNTSVMLLKSLSRLNCFSKNKLSDKSLSCLVILVTFINEMTTLKSHKLPC